jgi:hypothetical protein
VATIAQLSRKMANYIGNPPYGFVIRRHDQDFHGNPLYSKTMNAGFENPHRGSPPAGKRHGFLTNFRR